MITDSEKNYLSKIPDDKEIVVNTFDPNVKKTADEIIGSLSNSLPNLEIVFVGASALGIAGQNDIDINILSKPDEYDTYIPVIEDIYGEYSFKGTSVKWEFIKNGFDVELYLTDKDSEGLKRNIRVFNILNTNPDLLKEYEQIKLPLGRINFKEYMIKKFEFYNKILKDFS